MGVSEIRPWKRLKSLVTADLYEFLSFPSSSAVSSVSFRSSVQSFLASHAHSTSLFPSLQTWQILFRVGDLTEGSDCLPVTVTLDVVEEDVTRSPRSVYCNQCRVVGWSGHPVCRKRYHFIIRSKSHQLDGYQKACSTCGSLLHLSQSRCELCNCMATAHDLENWVYHQFEDNTHLLHGVVHSNGYGHLLTVNGREGGSEALSGFDIMNFWDRLCTALAVRKVSVMDVSMKYGTEFRLLHSVATGHSWYGNWGYEFGSGSYALTRQAYQEAVDSLSSTPLSLFLLKHRKPCTTRLQDAITLYQSLSDSKLETFKDLFSFLLRLMDDTCKPCKCGTPSAVCDWTRNDVDRVQRSLIKVLAAAVDGRWVSRRALKGAVCKAASSELLDHSIKHLSRKLTDDTKVVRTRCSPHSSAVEFRLELLSSQHEMGSNSCCPTVEQLRNDLRFVYDCLLNPKTMVNYRPEYIRECMVDAATKLVDCKQFMKDYALDRMSIENENPVALQYWCHLEISNDQAKESSPPPELIILPLDATVADLKIEFAKCFQEVYPMFRKLEAEALPEYGKKIEDSFKLKFLVGSSGSVRIQGKHLTKYGCNRFRMERGTDIWVVDCTCGAKDDDGERMLACDTCSVWQHTRCVGIDSLDEIPANFICMKCAGKESDGPGFGEARGVTRTCRGHAVSNAGSGFTVTLDIL